MITSVTEKNFSRLVLESSSPVLVHFWAPWCGVCRLVEPTLLKFVHERTGDLQLFSINADENFRLANTYRLQNLPTLMLFHQGKLVERLEGFHSREELQRNLGRILNKAFASSVTYL
jgi:thioredoxin 1